MAVEVKNSLSERKEMFRCMLADAVAVLCRNTMPYNAELSIEGLIGITADKKDIVLVSINEIIGQGSHKPSPADGSTPATQSPRKPKNRKRKKMRLSNPGPEKENKISKMVDDNSLVSQLSKELADFDVDSFVKKELPEVSQGLAPYGGYRNELYNTNDHQLTKTDTADAPSFPVAEVLQQFADATAAGMTTDFTAFTSAGGDPAAALNQPHSELLLERLDENGGIVYQCTICQKIIKSKGNFGRHIKGHVNSAVIHTCDRCGKTFGRKDNLRRHLHMVHQIETPTKGSNAAGEDGDSVGDMIPGLSDSISGALESTEEHDDSVSNSGQAEKAVFPHDEENHAAKYFQQHSISSLGLDGKPDGEEEEQHSVTVNSNSITEMTTVTFPQDATNNTHDYFQQPKELAS